MAADTDTRPGAIESFGRVSRTVGTVFRYVLLVATLVGILTLGILLVYVSLDAFRPFTADIGWLVALLVLVVGLPVAVGALLLWRTERGLTVGLTALGIPAIGLLFGSGAAVLFIDILPPVLWLAYLAALAIPVGVLVAVERLRGVPFLAKVAGALVLLVGSFAVVPGLVMSAPFLPSDWLIMVLTLGVGTGLVVRWYAADRWKDARTGTIAGALTLAASVAGAFVGPAIGISAMPAVILTVSTVVPLGMYVALIVSRDPAASVRLGAGGVRNQGTAASRFGLVLPVALVGGTLLFLVLVDIFGFAGPNSNVNWQLLTSTTVTDPDSAGVYPGIVGSIMLMLIVAFSSFPVGVGAAVYLEEYAPENRFTRIVQVNISNLAGVPSVVYGLLGLGLFIRYLGSPPGTVVVGGLTLSLLILPIVIIAAQEAIRSVPDSLRQASYGMGATRWQTVRNVVLPRAFPGILTGTILALGRAIGETAPLLVIGAPNVFDVPDALNARVGALPLQIYAWATTFAGDAFYNQVIPAAVIVLLVILLTMNSVAIVLRNRYQREA